MKPLITFLFFVLVSCSNNNVHLSENDSPKIKDTVSSKLLISTPNGHIIKLGRKGENFYLQWMQDNQLKTLDSAYYSIEEGQAWTPVFVQENEDYIVLQAGCGSPCWIGIFLPLHNNDQPKVINEYLAFNLKSALVASINNDSIEIINLKSSSKNSYYPGKCESAFPGYCIDTSYIKDNKFIYSWTPETYLNSNKRKLDTLMLN